MNIVILGLSVTSSWGNGHATTYRSLIRGLAGRGHSVRFLERDLPWYAGNRDEPHPAGAITELYDTFDHLTACFEKAVTEADLVIVGSFVPEGARVGEWVTSVAKGITAFYDIDTPVTLAKLGAGDCDYITPDLIRRYRMYLSFTGGPTLRSIETTLGSPMARVLYCSVDCDQYRPVRGQPNLDLGYLGTYSDDRQPVLDALMLEPARRWPEGRFAVVGPMYPEGLEWPSNVARTIHLAPREHSAFYAAQRFTLNITRDAMRRAGYSPSVRLFEAAACGTPAISDWWEGLDDLFEIGREALVSGGADDTLRLLRDTTEERRLVIGAAARERILAGHTSGQRAAQLEAYWKECNDNVSPHTSRRNRRQREADDGLAAGMASERERADAGQATRAAAGGPADSRGVHQPARPGS
jgi:spore maturation protein CgeB